MVCLSERKEWHTEQENCLKVWMLMDIQTQFVLDYGKPCILAISK